MWFLPISLIVFTTILAIPMSRYMAWIMNGQYTPPRFFAWFEKRLDRGPQIWQQYAAALLIFNAALFIYGFIVLAVQPAAPLNPFSSTVSTGTGVMPAWRKFAATSLA